MNNIDKKCESIFDSIEALDKNYIPLTYRESYDYDDFIVESGFKDITIVEGRIVIEEAAGPLRMTLPKQ